MFTTEELDLLNKFFTVKRNLEDTLAYMDSKEKSNQWLLVDFLEKFEYRYVIYLKKSGSKVYKPFNEVGTFRDILNLISSYETKRK